MTNIVVIIIIFKISARSCAVSPIDPACRAVSSLSALLVVLHPALRILAAELEGLLAGVVGEIASPFNLFKALLLVEFLSGGKGDQDEDD